MLWVCCLFPNLALETAVQATNVERPIALLEVAPSDPPRRAVRQQKIEATARTAVGALKELQVGSHYVTTSPVQKTSARIYACNDAAFAEGVRSGMLLGTAYSLCPQLLCTERRRHQELARLRYLAEVAYSITPSVSLLDERGLVLECSGSLRLYGGFEKLLNALEVMWQQQGHRCDLGFAHTPRAAEIFARAHIRLPPDVYSVPERSLLALRSIPLSHTGWSNELLGHLQAVGLHTLGDLFALPRAPTGRRFGELLLQEIEHIQGERPDLRAAIKPRLRFATSLHLLEDLNHQEGLVFPMHRLLLSLTTWLSARRLVTDHIDWQFTHNRQQSINVSVQLAQPTNDVNRLLELSKLKIARTQLIPEINALRLICKRPKAAVERNRSLQFSARVQDEALNFDLLDLLAARLEDRVGSLAIADEHLPESSWRYLELNELRSQRPAEKRSLPLEKENYARSLNSLPHQSLRPLWLLPVPKRIEVRAFTLLRGPERINTNWQQLKNPTISISPDLQRDYYIAEDRFGKLCWIFVSSEGANHNGKSKSAESNKENASTWFLHGYFS